MKLIDKSALVAEIEKRIKALKNKKKELQTKAWDWSIDAEINDYRSILSFIDTLEVKEVDLEKEIKEIQRKYKTIDEYEGYPSYIYFNGIEWIAKHFFELGMAVNSKLIK